MLNEGLAAESEARCWCHACRPVTMRMVLCPVCGDKRCLHAHNHAAPCAKTDLHAHNAWVERMAMRSTPASGDEPVGLHALRGKYGDVLGPFVVLMEAELHANARKGDRPGWLAMSPSTVLLEIYWHTAKLSAAVKNNDAALICEYSADVANMAMMMLDVCGGLDVRPNAKVAG